MEKLYFAQHFILRDKRFIPGWLSALTGHIGTGAALLLLMLCPAFQLLAQQSTFSENFDNTESGELPEGWSAWQNGGGAHPLVYWRAQKYWPLGADKYVISEIESGREGMTDEDWLITPQITPVAGDYLMFDTRRSFFESGDMFYIRISKTTDKAPEAFTETLAAFTEADLPPYFDPVNGKIRLDLSDYVGTPIHIAFIHSADVGPDGESGIWLIDNVAVRPIQQAYVEDAYFRQATSPPQPPVVLGDNIVFAGTVQFALNGDYGTAHVSSITLTLGATTDPSLIKKIMVYYTPFEGVSDDDILEGNLPLFGTIDNPEGTFEITGSIDLELGTAPWFYFRYILDETRELTFPFPQIDATIEKYVVNGQEGIPSVTTYFGAMDVVPPAVPNDHFADAAELTTNVTRYGSSTVPATYEADHDAIVYCHNYGHPEVHSVWWYFVPPADGWITADLSESRFNSLLTFLDEDFNQLACNDDINEHQQQSRISDFFVTKGKKVYVRVSDTGPTLGNPYRNAGVVVLDFTFTVPLGTEGNTSRVSPPYPNPATGQTSLDLAVKTPGEVTLEIKDVMGRKVLLQKKNFASSGSHRVDLDVSGLPDGSYIVHVRGGGIDTASKLIVTR